MLSRTIRVGVKSGLDVNIARQMADLAEKYDCRAVLKVNGADVNMGSLLNIVAMSIAWGDEVTVCCDGADEKAAVDAYIDLIQ